MALNKQKNILGRESKFARKMCLKDGSKSRSVTLRIFLTNNIGITRVIYGFFSIVSIHAVFFCMSMGRNYLAVVDVAFVGNITFIFAFVLALAVFSMRVIPPFMGAALVACIYLFVCLVILIGSVCLEVINKYLKNDTSMKYMGSLIDGIAESGPDSLEYFSPNRTVNKVLYSGITAVVVISLFYAGLYSAFVMVLIPAMVAFIIWKIWTFHDSLEESLNRVELRLFFDFKSLTYKHLKNDPDGVKRAVNIAYIFLAVFAACSGILRYEYLLDQNPFMVKSGNHEFIGNYIGTTSNGVLIRNCKKNNLMYISYDDELSLEGINYTNSNTTDIECEIGVLTNLLNNIR